GIGNLANKVKSVFHAIAKPINRAIDKIVGFITKKGKALWDKLKSKSRGGNDTPAGKAQRLNKGMQAAVSAVNKYRGRPVGERTLRPLLATIRMRYGLTELKPVQNGDVWGVFGKVNPSKEELTQAPTEAKATGMLAAYRGIHFKVTWNSADYDKAVAESLVGKPTFSAAARRMAGSTKPDGSDVPEATLIEKAKIVCEMVKKTKDPRTVEQWWPGKEKMQFESTYLGLLQRYVNSYNKFEQEMKDPTRGSFIDIPFISTSKNPLHSSRYAKGEKFIDESEKRTSGTVGRVFVYLFSLADIQKQDPANISQLANPPKKIKLKARLIHEAEVTFNGIIPGENLAAQHDAKAEESPEQLAKNAAGSAQSLASSQGGLREWSQ
ncbi:hypothetical protein ABT126_07460, partial [Streptomyces sp. NPDC002012]